ncbi:MAG: hypothetical protein HOE90_07315 [Bacteriovoracaceae bacterium]|nr:hypothetical protein [Bacteriovoracaceae bacterium]
MKLFVSLLSTLFYFNLWADSSAIPAKCVPKGVKADGVTATNRVIRIVSNKIIGPNPKFCSDPKYCKLLDISKIIKNTEFTEYAIYQYEEILSFSSTPYKRTYSCVKAKSGEFFWVSTNYACRFPSDRQNRKSSGQFPYHYSTCPYTRSISKDPAFFSGDFKTLGGSLKTRLTKNGGIEYQLKFSESNCKANLKGLLKIESPYSKTKKQVAKNEKIKFEFSDDDVLIESKTAFCGYNRLEFYYDYPAGLVSRNQGAQGGSLCQMDSVSLKESFIKTYFSLKRAAIKKFDYLHFFQYFKFPFRLNLRGRRFVKVGNKADFLKYSADILPKKAVNTLSKMRLKNTFCKQGGHRVMLGSYWFDETSIFAVNPH